VGFIFWRLKRVKNKHPTLRGKRKPLGEIKKAISVCNLKAVIVCGAKNINHFYVSSSNIYRGFRKKNPSPLGWY
jgi:hypothetical protein